MISRFRLSLPLLALVAVPACPLQKGGLVMFVDESYTAKVYSTSTQGFSAPDGIAFAGERLYLADEAGSAISVQSANKTVSELATASSGLQSPEDIVVSTDGMVFFTDDDAGGLWQVGTDGRTTQLAGKEQGLVSTEGLVIAPGGNLLVGDGLAHTVFEVTREGKVSIFLGPEAGIEKPESMAFDDRGNLYIADNVTNVVYRVGSDRRVEKIVTTRDGLAQPESLCFADGALYITDDETGKLYRYTERQGLTTVAVFAGRLQNVQGITSGPENSILISVQDLKRRQGLVLRIESATRGTPPGGTLHASSR